MRIVHAVYALPIYLIQSHILWPASKRKKQLSLKRTLHRQDAIIISRYIIHHSYNNKQLTATTHSKSPHPVLTSPTRTPSLPPHQPVRDRLSLQPVRDRPSLQPVRERPSLQPVRDRPSVQPVRDRPSVQPVRDRPSLQPVRERPSHQPARDRLSLQPVRDRLSVQPVRGRPSVQPVRDRPSRRAGRDAVGVSAHPVVREQLGPVT